MPESDEIDVLSQVCVELQQALTGVLAAETMPFVEKYKNACVQLERLKMERGYQDDCVNRIEQARRDLKRLPPLEIFIGIKSAREVMVSYLRWAARPTSLKKIAADLSEAGWVSASGSAPNEVLKSLNAGLAGHRESWKPVEGKRRDKLFRVLEGSDEVALLEWH